MMQRTTLVLALCGLMACGDDSSTAAAGGGAAGSDEQIAAMNAAIAELEARPEREVQDVEVQHILISFAGRRTPATRTKQEAEALAADIYAQVQAGADFDALVREHTDDSPPGIYAMTTGTAREGVYQRTGMVPAFGNVGWRLDVGEVGVAPFDPTASPFGWHIVKRTK